MNPTCLKAQGERTAAITQRYSLSSFFVLWPYKVRKQHTPCPLGTSRPSWAEELLRGKFVYLPRGLVSTRRLPLLRLEGEVSMETWKDQWSCFCEAAKTWLCLKSLWGEMASRLFHSTHVKLTASAWVPGGGGDQGQGPEEAPLGTGYWSSLNIPKDWPSQVCSNWVYGQPRRKLRKGTVSSWSQENTEPVTCT